MCRPIGGRSLSLLALAFLLGLLAVSARADITVLNAGDAGAGSLRKALADIPTGGTINFDSALSGQTINLASELAVAKTVIIDGSSLPAGIKLNGGSATRLFSVAAIGNLTLRSLTLTGGNGVGTVESTKGGAIHNLGAITLERCTLSGNTSTPISGGAIWTTGTATLTQCTLAGNASGDLGGAIVSGGATALTHCTISGNTATNFGGGVMISGGTTTVTNCILSGNTAANGPDIWSAGPAGGILRLGANVIGNAGKTPDAPDSGPAAITANPLLGPLADNGGPTQTMALLAYSQAIDAVPASAVVAGLDLDQRGFARALGSGPDLGAYESGDANFTGVGLTLFARLPAALIGGGLFIEISDNAGFSVPVPIVSTLAGTPNVFGSANGSRLEASFGYPSGVAQDSLGNYFVADTGNNVIRMITPDGDVTTIAGTGTYGRGTGPGLSAALAFPSAIAVGPDDNVYVADTYNHRICKLTRPATAGAEWTVSTLAGSATAGFLNGAGSVARFTRPYGLDLDSAGNVYVADAGNNRIRKITPAGTVTTFAGDGTAAFADSATASAASFDTPQGLVIVAKPGFPTTVCVADRDNNRIRKIATTTDASGLVPGAVTTLAGTGTAGFANGPGATAQFRSPSGLASDSNRNVFVADEENHSIRKIAPDGTVTSLGGSGTAGFLNGLSTVALYRAPTGLVVARDGKLIVADSENHLLRSVAIDPLRVAAIPDPANINAVGEQVSATLDLAMLGLNPGTKYYFRYRLEDGTTQTLAQNFTYIELPAVVTVAADNLTPTAGRLKGTVNPKNLPTSAMLEYSTEPTLLAPYAVTTVAGTGAAGFLDSPTASLAQFRTPQGMAVSGGSVYVADFLNHRIRRISPAGAVTTFAGAGTSGLVNGTGAAARFDRPAGIAVEPDLVLTGCATVFGNTSVSCASSAGLVQGASVTGTNIAAGTTIATVPDATHFVLSVAATGTSTGLTFTAGGANFYVADEFNHCIRKISASGQVTVLAGSGIAGFVDGAAGVARFLYPSGVALDASSPPNVYVADSGNHCIRKVASNGTVTTFAGTGVSGFGDGAPETAQFASPRGVAVTPGGDVLVADTGNHLIRAIAGGSVATFAGTTQGFADGPGASAKFNAPSDIAAAADGAAFVTDAGNHRIRRIGADAVVSTYAGSGVAGAVNSPVSGLYPVSAAQFNSPSGVAVDGAGGVLVTQEGLVRKIARGALPAIVLPAPLTGASVQAIAGDVTGLLPGTAYYFRAKGTCLQATVTGAILNFTTPAAPITVSAGPTIASTEVLNGQTDAIDFGATPRGTPVARQFTISNPNGTPFTVTAINVPAGYQVTAGGGVTLIAPGATLTFEVTLLATTGGTKSGNLVINSDAPGLGTFTFPITGVVFDVPVVTTLAASGNSAGNATLNANVNPVGATTAAYFQLSVTGLFDGQLVSTLAGSTTGYAEGSGAAAMFNQPYGLAADGTGSVFVADTKNHRIRKVAPDGTVTKFAGTGVAGFADGPGATAQFNEPVGLVFAGGTLYVSDSRNHRIRAITGGGEVRTYSGTGEANFTDGVAIAARFSTPMGLAIDAGGTLYVADRDNHRIRKVATDGSASTLAGTGVAGTTNGVGNVAQFDQPLGIAVDAAGFVYVTEASSHAVRKLAPDGTTSVFAGSAGTSGFINGTGAVARFASPAGLGIDDLGTIYVADRGNHSIRRITSTVGGGGAITATVATHAGLGSAGTANGLKAVAQFDTPISVVANGGDVVVGELTNSTIRDLAPTEPLLPAASGLTGTASLPVHLDITGLTIGTNYTFRAVAANVRGITYGNALGLLAGTPFELWQLAKFGLDAGDPVIAGEAATPAHDGITNRIKYALGLDPFTDAVGLLPDVEVNGGTLSITYSKVLAATDIHYQVEWSSDLLTWDTAGLTDQIFPAVGGMQQIITSIPIAPHRVKFLRLVITFQ